MAKSVLDIVINLVKKGGADKETIKGLVNLKNTFTNVAGAAGLLVGAGVAIDAALDQTVGKLVEYADQVRRVSDATGITAEDASKLIQVLDDQKISYEQLTKAIQTNGKEYDFSIAGLAGMSEQYLKLSDSQAKASFMQERFGKQWMSFVPLMEKGGDAIRDYSDGVAENLILTQKILDDTRKYELAVDSLNDTKQGLALTVGTKVLPVYKQFLDGVNVYIRAIDIARETGMHFTEATDEAGRQIWLEQEALLANKEAAEADALAIEQNTAMQEANAQAVREQTNARRELLGLAGNIFSEMQNFSDQQAELTERMRENRAEAEKLYPWQVEELGKLNTEYAELEDAYNQNAETHRLAMAKIQHDLLMTKFMIDGQLTPAEMAMIQQFDLASGLIDQAAIDLANYFDQAAAAVADGKLRIEDMQTALALLPKYKSIDVVLNIIQQMTGGTHIQKGGAAGEAGIVSGFASGTDGWRTVPSGYPNDSYPIMLTSGEKFAVIPANQGSDISGQGAGLGGSGTVVVNLNVQSPVTIVDRQSAQAVLLPFIMQGIREARARGVVV